jgi:hypothetical protein
MRHCLSSQFKFGPFYSNTGLYSVPGLLIFALGPNLESRLNPARLSLSHSLLLRRFGQLVRLHR